MLQGTMAFAAWVAYDTGMFLAINELLKEKTRFILIVAVIALVSYLTFFLTARQPNSTTSRHYKCVGVSIRDAVHR